MKKLVKKEFNPIADIKIKAGSRKITQITDLNSIIEYVNDLTTNKIVVTNDLRERMDIYQERITRDDLKNEFEKLYKNTAVYKSGDEIYPMNYKLLDVKGSEVQLVMTESIAVVQDLLDKVIEKTKLTGIRKHQIYSLMGALDELCYYIDPIRNQLQSLSADQTHLRKMTMAIYMNASKLVSLEQAMKGSVSHTEQFEQYIKKLPYQVQVAILREYLIPAFEPEWISLMSQETRQVVLNKIIQEEDSSEYITPLILVDLINKLPIKDRKSFLEHLSINFNKTDLDILEKAIHTPK